MVAHRWTKTCEDGTVLDMLEGVIWREKPVRKTKSRNGWKFCLRRLRLREIEKLIRRRHGLVVPDPENTHDRDLCLAYVRCAALTTSGQDMKQWCARWAPWIDEATLTAIHIETRTRKAMLPSDAAAAMLYVRNSERVALSLRTIGAYDLSAEERKTMAREQKRERDRMRQERKRRAEGRVDRKSQRAASKTAREPWKAMGKSRSTYYRLRLHETEVSPTP